MNKDELAQKLSAIGRKIEQTKEKLEHHGVFSKDHQVTQRELNQRFNALQEELNDEVTSLETSNKHVSQLEDTFLSWLNAIEFDFE